MRAVVKKRFKDKYTDEVYEAGSELEITSERYAEIRTTDAALIVAVAEEPDEQAAGQRDTADTEPDEQIAGQQGTADIEPNEQEVEAAGQTKPKRAKKQAKQDE